MTSEKPSISEQAIEGNLADIDRLADLINKKLENAKPGDSFSVGKEYSEDVEASLIFEVKEEGFDPASADKLIA